MFDLEQAIAEWRRQMLAAGIKTPVPLDELEGHLREDMDRQVRSGSTEQSAFETASARIGKPKALKEEFRKNGGASGKKIGIAALLIGITIVVRILTERPDAAHYRLNEQREWLITAAVILLFGLYQILVKRAPAESRDFQLWKLIGNGYSAFSAAFSILLIEVSLTAHDISRAFSVGDRISSFIAVALSLSSVLLWRHSYKILPTIESNLVRTLIGSACCILAVVGMLLFIAQLPSVLLARPVNETFVLFLWAWAFMAILGGTGYGLREAVRHKTENIAA